MNVELQLRLLRLGDRFEPGTDPEIFDLILGNGQSIAAFGAGGTSIWLPLRGALMMQTADGSLRLQAGQMLIWTTEEIRVSAPRRSLWLALAGSAEAWSTVLSEALSGVARIDEPVLYPRPDRCPPDLRRLLFALLRSARGGDSSAMLRWRLQAAVVALWQSQQPMEALAQRCPGRSRQRRRVNLLRLLKVRNRILMNPTARADLLELARSANYSPWHFTRAFREVFGEAPCEYANRIRLEFAHQLVREDQLTVAEIASMIGYDSRSAFCRSFRHAFGVTASQLRSTATG